MILNEIVACIVEGNAEHAIIDILYENDMLVFQQLLDDKPIKIRGAKNFESVYLRKKFENKISIVRILDSRSEKFKLSKIYEHKVEVCNIITAPEIEILIIISEGKYYDYGKNKSKVKPSVYCKDVLNLTQVKSYHFVSSYFKDVNKLLDAIKKYNSYNGKKENSLYDIIKPEFLK